MSTSELSAPGPAGLFHLLVHSTGPLGAPRNTLNLTVYTPKGEVTGHSQVTQAVSPPVRVDSHVTGTWNYEIVGGKLPGTVRIDLNGWPEIHWPPRAGIGPVIPQNYKSTLLLRAGSTSGVIRYEYRTDLVGAWHVVAEQPVEVTVEPQVGAA
ncbi:MAG: DUF1842 domain-containing protein [Azospirillaceae bacterium]|nr:DUF1842 domain-containing protein [Azospirillaceae bacterium]